MSSKKKLNTLLASAVALTVAGGLSVTQVQAGPGEGKEKCYGVVKAGQNGCANAQKTHSCAGQAKTDGDWGEWVAVPKGLCDKLVGGSTTPKEPS